jgi:hypothetical protein
MPKTEFRTRLDELSEEELNTVNHQLALVAETSKAHLNYMDTAEELSYDDYGLQILEEAFLFLYQVWIEQQQEKGTIPTNRTLN